MGQDNECICYDGLVYVEIKELKAELASKDKRYDHLAKQYTEMGKELDAAMKVVEAAKEWRKQFPGIDYPYDKNFAESLLLSAIKEWEARDEQA